MTPKTGTDTPRDPAPRKPQKANRGDELEASELDKVTGGMAAAKIVKSADPCEGGR